MKTNEKLAQKKSNIVLPMQEDKNRWYRWALMLACFTIFYNLIEGFVAVWFGFNDETLALFGFGLDSFIEVLSGIGILHMVNRLRKFPTDQQRDRFETLALRITGTAFYLLIAGIALSAIINIATKHQPETTFWGVMVSSLSIATMYFLMRSKIYVGNQLHSAPIKADANCTKACLYMSFLLLASSLIYEWTGFAYVDSLGALGIMWFAWKEGKEAFYKASHKTTVCSSNCT
jgi:divalent metal cation (Fe/Co/Zn/Cd) transporter